LKTSRPAAASTRPSSSAPDTAFRFPPISIAVASSRFDAD
jgi:hypothetical protein